MAAVTPRRAAARVAPPSRSTRPTTPAEPAAGQLPAGERAPTPRSRELAEVTEDEVLRRPAAARGADHPRDHADLRHARARLQVDAGRGEGRSGAPVAGRRRSSTRTPASRTTTCATTSSTSGSRSRPSRLEARATGHARGPRSALTGAEWIRQLPTLRLFKISMDLEMEGGHRGARGARPRPSRRRARRDELSRIRRRVDPRDPGADGGGRRSRTRRPPRELGMDRAAAARAAGVDAASARLLRRVAAILFHRRAGFSANGMGVWKVPEDRIAELGAAHGRVPRHLALLPAARPTPTGPTASSRWRRALEGGVRRRPRLDRRGRPASRTERRSTRRPRSRRSACTTSRTITRLGSASSESAGRCATSARPSSTSGRAAAARRGQLARPRDARDRPRSDLRRARRGRRARRRRRQPLRRLGLLLGPADPGHAHPEVVEAVTEAAARGRASARRPRPRWSSAAEVVRPGPERRDGADDLVRAPRRR